MRLDEKKKGVMRGLHTKQNKREKVCALSLVHPYAGCW